MAKIDEEVLIGLIKKGIEIEEGNAEIILKLFVAEEEYERRIALYNLLRDSEYHKTILKKCLRVMKAEMPELPPPKSEVFKDMLTTQRMSNLKEIITVIKDFYMCLLEDIKLAQMEHSVDKDKIDLIFEHIQMLYREKLEQLKKVEEMKVF